MLKLFRRSRQQVAKVARSSVLHNDRFSFTWPGMTLLALGHVSSSPTVQTRPARDSSVKHPHSSSYVRNLLGSLHRLSRVTTSSAAATIGSRRSFIGTVPACP
jgi:hypothetical protein